MLIIVYNRCFPHVVNLAVQAVLSSIANEGYNDIIGSLRTLINKV